MFRAFICPSSGARDYTCAIAAYVVYRLVAGGRLLVLFFNAATCPFCGLRGPPSWAWQKFNRLLRLGRP